MSRAIAFHKLLAFEKCPCCSEVYFLFFGIKDIIKENIDIGVIYFTSQKSFLHMIGQLLEEKSVSMDEYARYASRVAACDLPSDSPHPESDSRIHLVHSQRENYRPFLMQVFQKVKEEVR